MDLIEMSLSKLPYIDKYIYEEDRFLYYLCLHCLLCIDNLNAIPDLFGSFNLALHSIASSRDRFSNNNATVIKLFSSNKKPNPCSQNNLKHKNSPVVRICQFS